LNEDLLIKALASPGRLKILRLLFQEKELNISQVGKKVKLPYKSVNQHLKILKKVGFVEEEKIGRIRIFRVKEENKKCEILRKLFET